MTARPNLYTPTLLVRTTIVPPRRGRLLVMALAAAVIAAALLASASPAAGAGPIQQDAVTAWVITEEINRARAEEGLRGLRRSDGLARGAAFHAASMAREGYFGHSDLGRRLSAFYPGGDPAKRSVGETLYWTASLVTPAAVVSRWLSSPSHRRALLAKRWRDVGVAVVRAVAAPGAFGGQTVTIVVVDFGRR